MTTPEALPPDPDRAPANEEPTRVRVHTPGDFLSVVPVLLGFQPDEGDVVLTGLDDRNRVVVTARFAQPTAEHFTSEQLGPMLSNLRDAGTRAVMLTGYGLGQQITRPLRQLTALVDPVLPVRDALRVEGDRYWSYACQDPSCCPPEGRQFQAETASTTTLRVAGLTAEASRDELAERFRPPTGTEAEAASEAWAQIRRRPVSVAAGRAAVDRALEACRDGQPIDPTQAIELAAALTALPVRDHAWAHMTSEHRMAHAALWSNVLRHVPLEAAAAPATLLAWTAWQQGNGALGHLAADRALEADPKAYDYIDVSGQDPAERAAADTAARDLAICRAALIAHDRRRCWTVTFVDTEVKPPQAREIGRYGIKYAAEDA